MPRKQTSDPGKTTTRARQATSAGRRRRSTVATASFRRFYDLAPDMFAIVDATSGRVLDCNRALETCIGYPKQEIVGRDVFDLYHRIPASGFPKTSRTSFSRSLDRPTHPRRDATVGPAWVWLSRLG